MRTVSMAMTSKVNDATAIAFGVMIHDRDGFSTQDFCIIRYAVAVGWVGR